MRILFLTTDLPYPPYGGAPLRNFGLIEGLAADHDVCLLSFNSHRQIDPDQTPLKKLCEQTITIQPPQRSSRERLRDLLLTQEADMARRYLCDEFAEALRALLNDQTFDLIQIENLEMAVYLPVIKATQPDPPVIYDAHNAEYALQRRICETDRAIISRWHAAAYSYVQARRLRAFERQVCETVDYVIAVSDTDAGLLRDLKCDTPIAVVPNGISANRYQTPAADPVSLGETALVFTGKMDYRPNVDAALWFAGEVLPRIRQEMPNAHFYVVGQKPHARLNALRGQAGVTLTGFVPEVLPYLQAASVFVVPLRMGSGTRLKVLEAMAAARPIVSTRIGAQGLNVEDCPEGDCLILADTAETFAEAVIDLQKDRERAAALEGRAQKFAVEGYDWAVLLPRLLKVYEELGVV